MRNFIVSEGITEALSRSTWERLGQAEKSKGGRTGGWRLSDQVLIQISLILFPLDEHAASSELGRKKSGQLVQLVLRFPRQRVQDQAAGNGGEIATAATWLQYLELIPCDGRDG